MKLVLAIVQDKDGNRLSNEFIENGIRATKLSTTGGFLKAGNTTFIIGIEEERVDEVLDIIRENCSSREQYMMPPSSYDVSMETNFPYPVEVEVGGATVFVCPVDQFQKF
ncbi:cyclic-di-AMP receptor [Pisciglobus halotolerans]|uniref:Uncharacterized protein YaaQ n=1 Tax=Pisciglobus halotolerans TaxID=745365 RepID=A0A1I3CNI2_9LACT|nr:cyclic-di-AMP receptor [Pisciglobus halotolerans]SFH75958.1 Uncharacterized protein YaaQ [Pisciglobus halotolerans]